MLIKSIKLENIRSYSSVSVDFPAGSTLLAGDIGAGKTTILLAVEFALFGIQGKTLPGAALLRNGKRSGSVELCFEIDGKEVVIKRSLKRKKDVVSQESGYVIVDGVKKDKTPVELKSEIINLLGYPAELAGRAKNLVYRFTVYTPQEEMKQILLEPEEARVDTLRKVFGIDKYKKIRENCAVFVKQLKDNRKKFEGQIMDLEEKKRQKQDYEKEILEITESLSKILPGLEKIKQEVLVKKQAVSRFEQDVKDFNNLKNELAGLDAELKGKIEQDSRNAAQLEALNKQIEALRKEMGVFDSVHVKEKVDMKKDEISQKEALLKRITQNISMSTAKRQASLELKNKILHMSKCPTCEQEVSKEHKELIMRRENKVMDEMVNVITALQTKELAEEGVRQQLKKELEVLQQKESSFKVMQVKQNNIAEKQKQADEIERIQHTLRGAIASISAKKAEIEKQVSYFTNLEEKYSLAKKELEEVLSKERNIELEKNSLEIKKSEKEKMIVLIKQEIEVKMKAQEEMKKYALLQNWLEEYFIKLMEVMEKHVMAKAHADFSDFFQNWFNILIEDEAINVRVDDSFTPVIEQNGYETDYNHLSGGERTAVALAYRLALNKVINELMSGIKTRDLIILDEPTDGFSTEQLDRIRDVLEQINARQVILVSHESKIEGFVDNVIRVNKHEHLSEVGV
jgi:exonuclease SbcC